MISDNSVSLTVSFMHHHHITSYLIRNHIHVRIFVTADAIEEPNIDDDVLMQVVKEMKLLRVESKAIQASQASLTSESRAMQTLLSEYKASQASLMSESKASHALLMSEFRKEVNKIETYCNKPIGKK